MFIAAKPSAGARQFSKEDYAQLTSHRVEPTDAWLPVEGVTQVWYITKGGNKNVTLHDKERGNFFSAECYLVLHVFSDQSSVQKSILYFWQGAEAGSRTWPSFQLSLAPMIDKTITAGGHPAPQRVRLFQGSESSHFLQLFGCRMLVHRGQRPPKGLENISGLFETRVFPLPSTRPKPQSKDATAKAAPEPTHYSYGIQVASDIASLKSNQHYLLRTGSCLYNWRGRLAPALANNSPLDALLLLVCAGATVPVVTVNETEEPSEFLAVLGGKDGKRSAYTDVAFWSVHDKPARLFRFANLLAEWTVMEVRHFMQYDLSSSEMAALLLDTHAPEIFLWTPAQLTEQASAAAVTLAKQYVAEAQKAGRQDVRLITVEENKEELEFTAHFFGWYRKETFKDPYAEREARMLQEMRDQARLQAVSEAAEAERRRVELEARNQVLKSKQRHVALQTRQVAILDRLARVSARVTAVEQQKPSEATAPAAATLPVVKIPPVTDSTGASRAERLVGRQERVLAALASQSSRLARVVAPPLLVSPAPPASISHTRSAVLADTVPVTNTPAMVTTIAAPAPTLALIVTPSQGLRMDLWLALVSRKEQLLVVLDAPVIEIAAPEEPAKERGAAAKPHATENATADRVLLWYTTARYARTTPIPASTPATLEAVAVLHVVHTQADAPVTVVAVPTETKKVAAQTPMPTDAAQAKEPEPTEAVVDARSIDGPVSSPSATAAVESPTSGDAAPVFPTTDTPVQPAEAPDAALSELASRDVVTPSSDVAPVVSTPVAVAEPPTVAIPESAPAPLPATEAVAQQALEIATPLTRVAEVPTDSIALAIDGAVVASVSEPVPAPAPKTAPAVVIAPTNHAVLPVLEPTTCEAPSQTAAIVPTAVEAPPASDSTPTAVAVALAPPPEEQVQKPAVAERPASPVPAQKAVVEPASPKLSKGAKKRLRQKRAGSVSNSPGGSGANTPQRQGDPTHFARLVTEYALAPVASVPAPDVARVLFLGLDHWRLFATVNAQEHVRLVISARMNPPEPAAPLARSQYYWLSVSSHLLYFYYINAASPLLASAAPPQLAVDFAASLNASAVSCITTMAKNCATLVSKEALSVIRSGWGNKAKDISALLSDFHSALTRDSNMRFVFLRFFSQLYRHVNAEVFNALLRGPVSCGVGIVLKTVLSELNLWSKAVNLPEAVTEGLHLLRQVADVLVMVKSPLVERSVRDAVCPTLTHAQLWRLFHCYQIDEFDGNQIHPTVLDLLRTLCDLEVHQQNPNGDVPKPPPPALEGLLLTPPASTASPITGDELTKLVPISLALSGTAALPAQAQALAADPAFSWLLP